MLPASSIWTAHPTKKYSVLTSVAAAVSPSPSAAAPAAAAVELKSPSNPTPLSKEEIEAYLLQHAKGTVESSLKLVHDLQTFSHEDLVGCIKSLSALDMLQATQHEYEDIGLSPGGDEILARGCSPEVFFLTQVLQEKLSIAKAPTDAFLLLGYKQCIERQWLQVKTQQLSIQSVPADEVLQALKNLPQLKADSPMIAHLLKRKLIKKIKRTYFSTVPGPKFASTKRVVVADLTKAMLDTGDWSSVEMRPFNIKSMGAPVQGGILHPLLKVRFEFRKILLGMGFEEMPTNRWVESSFWNFDSLFQPQQHPARDAHDTFFIKEGNGAESSKLDVLDPCYVASVQSMHESGGHGSFGYKYDWSLVEAKRNVLRTHTTAVSSQLLYALAQEPTFVPKKYFSIDRVFRNETVDKTHLAEFHQVEGLVADYGLTLGDLKGTIRSFFKAIGITQVRFKPAYNPYTEPSMEIFGFHPQLNKWTEIGNSGMFRPEMLAPMGFPKDVRVIAWGLSLERPTMIKTGEDHIKNLFGSGVSFDMMRAFPLARFEEKA